MKLRNFVSSCSKAFLQGILGLTIFVVFNSSLFGKHKVLSQMISDKKIDKDQVIYVRDVEACEKVGVEVVAVSWGYDSFDRLQNSNVSKISTSVVQLKQVLS